MVYITIDDIKKGRINESRLIVLTDDQDLGVVDEEKVASAIADAAETFEGFVRGRYTLPLTPVPGLARTINLDLATYAIYGLNPDFEIPKTVSERNASALKLLERIQDGRMQLYDESEKPAQPEPVSSGAEVLPGTRTFSRDTLKGF